MGALSLSAPPVSHDAAVPSPHARASSAHAVANSDRCGTLSIRNGSVIEDVVLGAHAGDRRRSCGGCVLCAAAAAAAAPSKKMKSKTDLWDKGKGLHGARSKSFIKTVGFYDNPEHTKNKPDKTVWDMKVQSDK